MPVARKIGDEVIGATLNTTGSVTFRATRVGKDSALGQIVSWSRRAGDQGRQIQQLADRVAGGVRTDRHRPGDPRFVNLVRRGARAGPCGFAPPDRGARDRAHHRLPLRARARHATALLVERARPPSTAS